MARILVNSSKTNSSAGAAKSCETTAATVTRRPVQNLATHANLSLCEIRNPALPVCEIRNPALPVCEIRMTSKLKTLLLEGRNRDQDDGERRMMPPPPPPPPAPRPLPQLFKLAATSYAPAAAMEDELVKIEPEMFGLGGGSELELLAEAAIASDPREDDYYDEGVDNNVNLGRNLRLVNLKITFFFPFSSSPFRIVLSCSPPC
jgi:hypothetical protein